MIIKISQATEQPTSSSAHSEKSVTIRVSNHACGVYKEHYAYYYVPKSSVLIAGTGVSKKSTVASGSSYIKIHYFYTDPHFQRKMFQECNFNSYTKSCGNHYTGQGLWQTFTQSGYDLKGIIDR